MQDTVTKDREKYIGGSDIPAVMGISPFTTRMDLLSYKAKIKENEFAGNEYTDYGNEMESKIRDYVNEEKGYSFKEDKRIEEGETLPIRYHADGYDENKNAVLEVKTTSEIFEKLEDYKMYLVQLVTGMKAFDAEKGVLAVYDRPEDMSTDFDPNRLQVFEFGKGVADTYYDEIHTAISDFRIDYKYIVDNPLASEEELPSRTAIAEITSKTFTIGDIDVSAEWLLGNEKELTTAIKTMKQNLTDAMGEHNIMRAAFANGARVTYVPQGKDTETEKLDESRLKEEEPTIYAKYVKKSVRKGKKAYVLIKH